MNRCGWAGDDPLMQDYHDKEWGRPVYDDNVLFEFLILEGMQAGLSWSTILKKRNNFRRAFDNFNAKKIAAYGDKKIAELLQNEGIIRNRLKINAIIVNAKLFLDIQKESGSFSDYIWQFVGGKPIIYARKKMSDIPTATNEAERMSKALKKHGFKFVGPTICYAFMQAVGMVNDHVISCDCYKELK